MDLGGATNYIGEVFGFSAFVLLVKPLLFLAILGWLGYGK